MSDRSGLRRDQRVEQVIGTLLRGGVLLAVLVALPGGVLYVLGEGGSATSYGTFHGEPVDLRHAWGIVAEAFRWHSPAIIQLGILLLIGTPIARVLFSLVAFALQRDVTYVVVTLLVLAALVYGLVGGNV
jgi:uncharacterized membrane protein